MGPNNLPAPSSFPQVEVVARECQHQLNGADGAASVSHLERYKSYIDDTGTMGFIVLQNSVGFDFYFFFLSVFHGSSKGFPCKCFLCIIDLSSFDSGFVVKELTYLEKSAVRLLSLPFLSEKVCTS